MNRQIGRPRCEVPRDQALRYLGYRGQTLDPDFEQRIAAVFEQCKNASACAWVYDVFPVRFADDGVRLEGTSLVLTGSDIRARLDGACECAVFAATCGLANERELQRLANLGGADALLFDAAGSALVEEVADSCNDAIDAYAAERGMRTAKRFSPGYGDLPLALQPAIIRVLAADRLLGITATASNLLIPAKTVTAFVAISNPAESAGFANPTALTGSADPATPASKEASE